MAIIFSAKEEWVTLSQMRNRGHQLQAVHYNILIDAYARSGAYQLATNIFEVYSPPPDIVDTSY
jgi:hypothetical protein